ncbi:hypothetical protein C8J56DRAFT_1038112 [Mycena floridula]|nr:hypothetical protein C8J56DRAFT_1038112 [Mycena floridula]
MVNAALYTNGPRFLGFIITLTLHGVLAGQLYVHLNRYRTDRLLLKLLPLTLFTLSTMSTMILVVYLDTVLIRQYGDVSYTCDAVSHLYSINPAINGIITLIVHFFSAHRLHLQTQGRFPLLTTTLTVFSLLSIACGGIYYSVALYRFGPQIFYKDKTVYILNIDNLKRQALHPLNYTIRDAGTALQRVFSTFSATALWSVGHLTVFLIAHGGVLAVVFAIPFPEIFSICLLSCLNSRPLPTPSQNRTVMTAMRFGQNQASTQSAGSQTRQKYSALN